MNSYLSYEHQPSKTETKERPIPETGQTRGKPGANQTGHPQSRTGTVLQTRLLPHQNQGDLAQSRHRRGYLFNYFRTKEDLALYFFQQQIADLIDGYHQDQRLKDAPLPEKLFSIIHRHLDLLEPYQEFIGAVYLRALQPVSRLSPISLDSQELSLSYLRFIRGILGDAERNEEIPPLGDLGAYAFWLFHLAIVTYWLQDQSRGKEDTLALLDRSLKVATSILKSGGWEW